MNTYDFSGLSDKLECTVEVTDIGKVILQEKLDVQVPAKSSRIVTIPSLDGLTGQSVYVRFIFTQKEDTQWSGSEIGFDQILICKEQRVIDASPALDPIDVSEDFR
ncbi:DUF4981 domain-containing protein [Cohnella sp. CFH 77786]|uniref:DUF4981 domain-containing protein n=1 Tax=Cohnella sp. CFH 77786 TaxID=2662265 RepID=UPI001C60E7D6|nr:DUF4981 domain-containing protein [Cohnella sp. CFH 77786]